MFHAPKNSALAKLQELLKLYGYKTTMIIVLKKMIKTIFGISWQQYYLMSNMLSPESNNSNKFYVRELIMDDYDNVNWHSFMSAPKEIIYKKRFNLPYAKAYGVFIDNNLAYSIWIVQGYIIIRDCFVYKVSPQAGFLLDAYCLPQYRRMGIDNFMTGWAINTMKEQGMNKYYGVVLSYNIPSIKALRKSGLQIERTFYIWSFRKKSYCTLRLPDYE